MLVEAAIAGKASVRQKKRICEFNQRIIKLKRGEERAQKALIKATQKSLEKSIPHAMSMAVITWADATTDASSHRTLSLRT